MHPYISCLFTLAVKPEEFAEFKALIAQIVPETQKEPGTLVYEYSVNEDNSTAHILERYRYRIMPVKPGTPAAAKL
jgi:quinol monooxygenase YgiN